MSNLAEFEVIECPTHSLGRFAYLSTTSAYLQADISESLSRVSYLIVFSHSLSIVYKCSINSVPKLPRMSKSACMQLLETVSCRRMTINSTRLLLGEPHRQRTPLDIHPKEQCIGVVRAYAMMLDKLPSIVPIMTMVALPW